MGAMHMCSHLEVGVAVVRAGRVDAVLIGDDFPELGADLVAALAGLDVNKFPHGVWCGGEEEVLAVLCRGKGRLERQG